MKRRVCGHDLSNDAACVASDLKRGWRRCKACANERARSWRKANPDQASAHTRTRARQPAVNGWPGEPKGRWLPCRRCDLPFLSKTLEHRLCESCRVYVRIADLPEPKWEDMYGRMNGRPLLRRW